jgi:hypothetical protein
MSGPNQVLDEQAVGRRVAERLDTVADGLGPVGLPDWDGVRSGLRRSVRRRRLKRTGMVAGALASVVAVGGSFQLGVLPYPSWAPAVTVAASAPSGLAMQQTKGNLAGDQKWLKAFREKVAAERWDEWGGESWSVVNPDDVKVLFAGDVGDVRWVAIEAPYRWGIVESRQQVWYGGPAGAEPADMLQGGNSEPSDVMATTWGPGYGVDGSAKTIGAVLLMSDGARSITFKGTPQYAADGTVTRPDLHFRSQDGALVFAQPASEVGAIRLSVVGYHGQDDHVSTVAGALDEVSLDVQPGRGVTPPREALDSAVSAAQGASGLPQGGSTRHLIWAGDEAARGSMAVAVKAPSGALIITMFHFEEHAPGVPDELELMPASDATTVLPITDIDQVALAWRQTNPWASGEIREGDWVGLVGPVAATKAEVLAADGSVVREVALTEGGGAVEARDADRVRYVDAEARVLATTKVLSTTLYESPVWER